MQHITSLKRPAGNHVAPLNIPNSFSGRKKSSRRSVGNKESMGNHKPTLTFSFAEETPSPILPQEALQNQNGDYVKARNFLSTIEDPLWKKVCCDLINMMGPTSVLKIWDSRLGEVCFPSNTIELRCRTEEAARFVQQYDFVVIGSLKPYFPALKELCVYS